MSTIRVCYQTIEFGKEDIHLRTLRDIQQYSDTNGVAEKLGISSANWPILGAFQKNSFKLAIRKLLKKQDYLTSPIDPIYKKTATVT